MALITEDHLEQQCLEWFKELGYAYAFAPDLPLDGNLHKCTDFRQQQEEGARLDQQIAENLRRLGYE